MDATVATGAAAMMAIRVLLDHDVPEENITLLSLLMAVSGELHLKISVCTFYWHFQLYQHSTTLTLYFQRAHHPATKKLGATFFGLYHECH